VRLASLLLALGLSVPAFAEAPAAPTIEDGQVLRPRISLADGTLLTVGSATAVSHGNRKLVITAVHLLGPAGGLPAQITAEQVGEKVKSLAAFDAFKQGNAIATSKTVLPVAGAAPMTTTAANDLLVFEVEEAAGLDRLSATASASLVPLSLASEPPAVGTAVWLAAPIGDKRVHPAQVVHLEPGSIFYKFADAALDLTATNGAPVLNAKGEVVALHLGGGPMEGDLIGSGNPVNNIRVHLDALKPG
jgi:hypothetical protein